MNTREVINKGLGQYTSLFGAMTVGEPDYRMRELLQSLSDSVITLAIPSRIIPQIETLEKS